MSGGDFAAIQARANAATEGPWARSGHDIGHVVFDTEGPCELAGPVMLSRVIGEAGYEDAEFIAHARVDIPALLAAVRERDNTIARVRALAGSPADADPLSGFKGQPDDMPGVDDFIDHGVWLQKAALRAALDPQETE